MIGSAKGKILVGVPTYLDLIGERKLPHAKELLDAQKRGLAVEPIIDSSWRIKSGVSAIEELKARGIDVKEVGATKKQTSGSTRFVTGSVPKSIIEQFNKDWQRAWNK